ncbi:MFS transporter [Tuberibacillus sp. Marseille-P3662]|uniref:MFS transporter n=1 Tax=Tuberibacillus sp. Marseille-P3662 TaxID=1965358 RepID=UPI000A1C9C5D|nr:MFS transporter [Tuberibacillus sp. Marseille-P3662]
MATADESTDASMKKATIATAMGNLVEWYEYGVYSYTAGIIGAQFFPQSSNTATFLYAFAVFALSFFLRPLGGMIFGSIGDRLGRKKILTITIVLMSASTAAIGIIPTYGSIGLTATFLLILMRMLQGLAAGGEYGGATVFMNESAPHRRRGLFTSFLESGVLLGYTIGAGFVACLTFFLNPDDMSAWGWRIPFICSLPLALTGMYLRTKLDDTPVYTQMRDNHALSQTPLREMFQTARKPLLIAFCCVSFANGAYYTLLTYLPSYFETEIGLSAGESLTVTMVGMIFMMLLIPIVGMLSDRFGRKLFMMSATVLTMLTAISIISFVSSGSPAGPIVGFLSLGILVSLFVGAHPSALPPLFPNRVRNSAYAFSYNVSTAIFGGGAPFIITSLKSLNGSPLMPAFFLMFTAIVAIIAIVIMPETAKQRINTEKTDNKKLGQI